MIDIDNFKYVLDAYGIKYRHGHKSFTLNHCPQCNSKKFKVAFALSTIDNGFLGKCFRGSCLTGYSASKYLILIDASVQEIDSVVGMGAESGIKQLINDVSDDLFDAGLVKNLKEEVKEATIFDDSQFITLSAIPNNPITKYAVSRGVDIEAHKDIVKGCMDTNAVVFMCGKAGWQKRFVNPNTYVKTLTMPGFAAHDNIIVIPREGKDVWICEGPFTAIAAWRYGYTGVCTFGAGISSKQLEKIKCISIDVGLKVGIAFDLDDAGEIGVKKMLKFFYGYDDKLYRVVAESGNDLSDSYSAGSGYKVLSVKTEDPSIPQLMMF